MLKDLDIETRVLLEAQYIIDTNATIRETAKKFGVSKSTVHKDVSMRIYYYSYSLGVQVHRILNLHSLEAPHKGGLANKKRYLDKKA
ncbi:MAG: stage III sporulation protein D [Clostridia bacterium]|nr:stage III sporulation protein D [Clostridia bacterium]